MPIELGKITTYSSERLRSIVNPRIFSAINLFFASCSDPGDTVNKFGPTKSEKKIAD